MTSNFVRRCQIVAVTLCVMTLAACNRAVPVSNPTGAFGWTTEGPTRVCVDENQNRVTDDRCGSARRGRGGWYYLGSGAFVPAIGRYVSGGAVLPSPKAGVYQSTSESMARAKTAQGAAFGNLAGKNGSGGGFFEHVISGLQGG